MPENRSNTPVIVLVILLSLSLMLIGFERIGVEMAPEMLGHSFFSRFQNISFNLTDTTKKEIADFVSLLNIREQREVLLGKLEKYDEMRADVDKLQKENKELREQLGYSEKIVYNNIPVKIIAKDPGNLFNSITVNKGSLEGLEVGMPVVAYQNRQIGLVGKIEQIGLHSALVKPIFDNSSYVAVKLFLTRHEGLIQGMGTNDGSLILKHVNKNAINEISFTNNLVVTSGMNSMYPEGIYIGEVKNVKSREYEIDLEISVEPLLDFSKLEYLIVLEKRELKK